MTQRFALETGKPIICQNNNSKNFLIKSFPYESIPFNDQPSIQIKMPDRYDPHINSISSPTANSENNNHATNPSAPHQNTYRSLELINHPLDSTQTAQKIESIIHDTEQKLFRELFKKDNFNTGKYLISYNPSTKKYTALDARIEFLKIAKKDLENSKQELEDANDMQPELYFLAHEDSIESLASDQIIDMFFLENGERSWPIFSMGKEGKNKLKIAEYCNHLEKFDNYYNPQSEQPTSVFSAQEMLHKREQKTKAVIEFENTHGKEIELIFNFSNIVFELKTIHDFSSEQEKFFSDIFSSRKIKYEEIPERIKNLFQNENSLHETYDANLEKHLNLLKEYSHLKIQEEISEAAFSNVEKVTKTNIIRDEIATKLHTKTIKEKESCENLYESVFSLLKKIDFLKSIYLTSVQTPAELQVDIFDYAPTINSIEPNHSHLESNREENYHHVNLIGYMAPHEDAAFNPQ